MSTQFKEPINGYKSEITLSVESKVKYFPNNLHFSVVKVTN